MKNWLNIDAKTLDLATHKFTVPRRGKRARPQMNRAAWKAFYRLQRIVRRECRKADMDMLIYGTGFLMVGSHLDGGVMRLDPETVMLKR